LLRKTKVLINLIAVAVFMSLSAAFAAGPAHAYSAAGPASWYGGPCDVYDNDIPRWKPHDKNLTPGIAMRNTTWSPLSLYLLKGPNGRYSVVQHTEDGPALDTGKLVDINFSAAKSLGYAAPSGCVKGFPTGKNVRVTLLNWRDASDWAIKTRTRLDDRWINERRVRLQNARASRRKLARHERARR
jgi:hypothetical protein